MQGTESDSESEMRPNLLLTRMLNDRIRILRTANLYLTFFSLGLTMSIPGPTLPDLEKKVQGNSTQMGYVLAAKFVGYFLGSATGGFLFGRYNRQLLFVLCLLGMSLSNLAIPYQTDLTFMIWMMVMCGIASGAIDTGSNVLCLDLWSSNPAPFLQALHFSFGVGSVVGPLIAEPFLSPDDNKDSSPNVATPTDLGQVETSYSIISGIVALVAISTAVSFCINQSEVRSNTEKRRDLDHVAGRVLPRCVIGFGMLFLASYACLENAFGQFLTTFVIKSRLKMTKSQGSFMTSVYWLTYCFVRGCSIYGATRVKPVRMLYFNLSVLAVTSVILAVWADANPSLMWFGAAMLGLGCSSVYPTGMAWIETYVGISNLVSGLILVSTSSAAFVVALIVGYFMDFDPHAFLYIICVLVAISIGAFFGQLRVVSLIKRELRGNLLINSRLID